MDDKNDQVFPLIIRFTCDADRETKLPRIYRSLRKSLTMDELSKAYDDWKKEVDE